jgi:hypothetical protein
MRMMDANDVASKLKDIADAARKVTCGICSELRTEKTLLGTRCRCERFGEIIGQGTRCRECQSTSYKEKIGTEETTLQIVKGMMEWNGKVGWVVSEGICCFEMAKRWGKEFDTDFDPDKFEDCKVRFMTGEHAGEAINYCPFCGAKVEIVIE